MNNDFSEIKERLDLLSVINRETGLTMKGPHLSECPFCSGHECFSLKDSHYKCFQCDESGDVFTFLEHYLKIEKGESLKRAAELAGIPLVDRKKRDQSLTTRERIFIEAATHYHMDFLKNGGRSYLVEKRGHDEEMLRQMRVGWSDGALVDHLKSKNFSDEEIKASGLGKMRKTKDAAVLADFFGKDLAIFPHYEGEKVIHFTMKDPAKQVAYQLPNEFRFKAWRFYNQNALHKYGEVILVEGENDTLSVLDAGVKHVIGLIGQPADYQIASLKTHCINKHLYLFFDNDSAGETYTRRIATALQGPGYNVRILIYSDTWKDPDEYLRGFSGDRRKELKRLQVDAVDYLTWEIGQVAKLIGLDKQVAALRERKVFSAISGLVEVEKLVYVKKLEELGLSRKAIEEEVEASSDLLREISMYLEVLPNRRDADPSTIATIIHKHFTNNGRFFRDRLNHVYLLYHHHIYEIGNNRPFNALIKRSTHLLPTKEPGRSVWEALASDAFNSGKQIDLASWIFTDRATDTIYVNLNSHNNMILKISKDSMEAIPNGLNKEGVLLKSSKKIMPFNFLPDADIRDGMKFLKDLIFNNMTCDKEQKYLVLCWFISAFLVDFVNCMAIMKFSGSTASGKTTAARMLSILVFGNEHLGDPSTAAAYAVASQNPMLIIDNLESDDITKSMLKFLLLSATGGQKEKRIQGSDTDTMEEKPRGLVLVTAIEPFPKSELINRAYEVEFLSKNKSDDFIEDEAIRALVKNRDLILSSILKLIQREILPNLARRKDYIAILKKEYKGHAKNRTDEYLAILMLILERILKYIEYYGEEDFLYGVEFGEREIRKAWIEYQDARAKETEVSSNNIIKLLDGLVREYLLKMKDLKAEPYAGYDVDVFAYQHPEYGLEIVKTKAETIRDENGESYSQSFMEFVATSADCVAAFDRYCKNNGLRNPYHNASVFRERFKNDRHLLQKSGWELITKEGLGPFYRIVRGTRFYKFRKVIVR
jgi:DNA primase